MKIDWKKEIKLPRPSLSGLRSALSSLSLKRPSLKRPKALSAGPQIKLPRVVTDLYGDLRDRHLLPLVALLVVAIIAAPILLDKGGDSKTEAPAAVVPSTGNEAPASSFSVVPAARRLRSPSKRLGHRQPLDPFRIKKQKQKQEGGSKSGEGTSGGAATSSTGLGGSTIGTESTTPRSAEIKVTETAGDKELTIKESTSNGPTSSSPNSSTPPPSESSGSEAAAAPVSPGSSTESSAKPTEATEGQSEVVGYTVDLKTGDPEGELTEENEVAPMTKLPTAKNPLVVFVGLSQDNKRALFLMTSKVTAYYGAVHCVVDAQACQLVELKPGKAALFEYISGETEAKYKVVLEKIEPVVSSQGKTAGATVSERPAGAQPQKSSPRADALSAARRFSK
jgi:hypothetical protein